MADHDPFDLAGQQAKATEAAEQSKRETAEFAADVKWLMADLRGRRVAYRLLERGGVFRLSFNTNAMTMAFNEGNRNFALGFLATLMEVCPKQYMTMINEARSDSKAREGKQDV